MDGGQVVDADHGSGLAALSRGPEHRVAALTLAVLLFLGGLMGSVNLFVDGMIHEGAQEWVYGGTMLFCMATAVALAARRRASRAQTFALVLLGDLIYVVVALCVEDAVRYATPLMLLFPAFVAAWFLGRWQLAVNLLVTPLAVLVAMWTSYEDTTGLVLQVVVDAGMLDAAAVGLFILRRRVQRLLEATQALTVMDPLTGLYNRRYLEEQAPRVWRQSRRDGRRVAAMVLDLDHFKRLNDAHGHAVGDAVLRAVAGALSANVRPADVLARTGGEELVVLGMVGDAAEARRLAERLRAAVSACRTDAGHGVTASIGVALTWPVDGEEPRDCLWRLIDRADAAMYEAKRQGRDRVAALLVPQPRPARAADPFADTPASDVA
ncbi:diguanylate cyclase [Geodermatophilus sp. URMC 64]